MLSTRTSPLQSMTDLLKIYEDPTLTQHEQAILLQFEITLCDIFIKSSPSKEWVTEIVSMAITVDKRRYQNILNIYLKFLKETPIIEYHHLRGLADILRLSGRNWITAEHANQLFAVLQNKDILYSTKLISADLYHNIIFWQQLCHVLSISQIKIPETVKTKIQQTLKAYKNEFRKNRDETGVELVKITLQSLYRTQDDAPSDLQKTAGYLQAAMFNIAEVTVSCGVAAGTFGVGSLAAVPPMIESLKNIGGAVITICAAMKEKWEKSHGIMNCNNYKQFVGHLHIKMIRENFFYS